MRIFLTILVIKINLSLGSFAEPQLTSWITDKTGSYARIFTSKENEAGLTSTTWSRIGVQNSPTYAGIHEIHHDDSWVYIKTSGLGFHKMGPGILMKQRLEIFLVFQVTRQQYIAF